MRSAGVSTLSANPEPTVSIIVPNFNGGELSVECIESLLHTDYGNLKVLLVDNCSTDNSRTEIAARFGKDSRMRILALDKNYSYTGAVSIGFRSDESEYVVLMNNDMIADPDWLKELLAAYRSDPSIGAVQAKLLRMDDPELLQYGGGLINRLGFTMGRGVNKPERLYNSRDRIFFAAGACLLTSRKVLSEVGLPDTSFLMYDDADLGWRIRLRGYEVLFVPSARVMHRGSMTLAQSALDAKRLNQAVYEHFAMILKNYSPKMIITVLPQVLFLRLIRLVSLVAQKELRLANATLAGMVKVLKLLKTIWGKRIVVQRYIRRVSDSRIVSLMDELAPDPTIIGELQIARVKAKLLSQRGRVVIRFLRDHSLIDPMAK